MKSNRVLYFAIGGIVGLIILFILTRLGIVTFAMRCKTIYSPDRDLVCTKLIMENAMMVLLFVLIPAIGTYSYVL